MTEPRRAGRITPLAIPETGDDSPARNVWAYSWRMIGWHQPAACLLALAVALLNMAPIELQRRIVDDAIVGQDFTLLIWLGICYAAVLAGHKGLKFALGMYQTWLGESTIRYTRLLGLRSKRPASESDSGQAVSVIGAEVDKLGGFVGHGPSQACVDGAMLVGIVGYMAIVQPQIAALSLALLVPQMVLAPVMQRRINRLLEQRLELMRGLGDDIAAEATEPPDRRLSGIYENRMRFMFWKLAMKALLNLLNSLAPLSVLIWGGWLAIEGQTTVGVLVAFLAGFEKLSGPIRGLITFYRTAAQAEVQHNMIAKWM